MKFKYVGSGDNPPVKTKFMGQIDFELDGPYVDVKDPFIVKKLKGNKCFKAMKRGPNGKQGRAKKESTGETGIGGQESNPNQ